MSEHNPHRPGWACLVCFGEWPCETRRLQLLAEFSETRQSLSIYLVGHLLDACTDLPGLPAGQLYARFMGWVMSRLPGESASLFSRSMTPAARARSGG